MCVAYLCFSGKKLHSVKQGCLRELTDAGSVHSFVSYQIMQSILALILLDILAAFWIKLLLSKYPNKTFLQILLFFSFPLQNCLLNTIQIKE